MPNIIRIKRSSTAGNTPSIIDGELAINQADMKLYVRNSSGVPKFIDFTSDAEKVAAGAIKTALDTKHPLNTTIRQNATSSEQRPWIIDVNDRTFYQFANTGSTGIYDVKDNTLLWRYTYSDKKFYITNGLTTSGIVVNNNNTSFGGLNLVSGDATHTGYLEFLGYNSGARHAYIGYSDGTNINVQADVGKFNFTGNAPTIGNSPIFTSANMASSGTADGTGYIPAGISP